MSKKGLSNRGGVWAAPKLVVVAAAGTTYTVPDTADVVQLTLDQASCAITLPAPSVDADFDLVLIQGSGGTKAVTFAGSLATYAGGALTSISTAATSKDVVHAHSYDGVKWVLTLASKAVA